jgi:hypothetical protein
MLESVGTVSPAWLARPHESDVPEGIFTIYIEYTQQQNRNSGSTVHKNLPESAGQERALEQLQLLPQNTGLSVDSFLVCAYQRAVTCCRWRNRRRFYVFGRDHLFHCILG